MALSSTSTIPEIIAAYVDNATYDVNNSLAQAKLFVHACRILLVKMPKEAGQLQAHMTLSPDLVKEQLNDALTFVANSPDATGGGGGGNRHFDFSDLRGECGGR